MKFSTIDSWLTAMKDYHLPICVGVFITGAVLQWHGRMDGSFVGFTGVVLGAVTGHAFSNHKDQG